MFGFILLAHGSLNLVGCNIVQHDHFSVTFFQAKILQAIDPAILLTSAGNSGDADANPHEVAIYQKFIGHMSDPLMLLHASVATTKLTDLKHHHLRVMGSTLARLKKAAIEIHFVSPLTAGTRSNFISDIISDGATTTAGETRGRSGCTVFCSLDDIVNPI